MQNEQSHRLKRLFHNLIRRNNNNVDDKRKFLSRLRAAVFRYYIYETLPYDLFTRKHIPLQILIKTRLVHGLEMPKAVVLSHMVRPLALQVQQKGRV